MQRTDTSVAGPGTETLTRELAEALGRDAVVTEPERLGAYAADTYWKALAAQASGTPLGRPDLAVIPETEEHVAATLRLANRHRVPVVPWGGGSGSQGGAVATEGGIVLDLGKLDEIVEVDEDSLTVTAQAGVNGLRLERELNRRGLMLPHYPASADLATVGGYVAARGSGVLSTRYGKIEDLVLTLRVATPTGELIDTLPVPRHAAGPGPHAALRRLGGDPRGHHAGHPAGRAAPGSPPLRGGQLPLRPGRHRSCPRRSGPRLPPLGRAHVRRDGDPPLPRAGRRRRAGRRVHAPLLRGGSRRSPTPRPRACSPWRPARGASPLPGRLAETWWRRRYDFYQPPHHPELPSIWGTIEAVASYRRIYDVYRAVKAAVDGPYVEHGLTLRVHLSHWYPWGTMIYGRFVVPDGGPDAVALHDRIWEDGVRAILGAGGVINDHHGIGLKLAPVHARAIRAGARLAQANQGEPRPEPDHESRQARPVDDTTKEGWMALKVAMHNWMRPEPIETTITRLGRSGYDGIEISGEPALYDTKQVRSLLEENGLECWGSVTLMVGGRDLLHEDRYVRVGSVQYVKDTIDMIEELGGKILTVVPSTVGKVTPMGSPEDEWRWAVESLKECQAHAEKQGVRLALEPLNRFETYFLNRCDQALALAEDVGGDCGVCLDIFHMNIEEADWPEAIRLAGDKLVDFHVADNNRMPPGQGAIDWELDHPHPRRSRLRRLPDGRVRGHRRPQPRLRAYGDR